MESVPHFELTIDKLKAETDVREFLLKVFPALSEDDIEVEVFPNSINRGVVNTMIKCSWKNEAVKPEPVIVRVQNMEMFKEFITNRSEEALFVRILHERDCAPKVIATFENGFCYEYLKGEVLSPDRVSQEPICWLVAKELAKIHASDIDHERMRKQPMFDDPEMEEKFKDAFPKEFADPVKNEKFKKELPPREVIEEEVKMVKEHIKSLGDQKIVLCHNDVRPENIVYDEEAGRATFVDFEALSYNYQAFELGNHFSRYCGLEVLDFTKYPTKEFQKKWIRVYLGHYYERTGRKASDVTDLDVERLFILVAKYNLILHLSIALFAPAMETFNLPIDFLSFGIESYKEYCQMKDEILAMELPN